MSLFTKAGVLLVVAVTVVATQVTKAADAPSRSTLTVEGMHCGGCAKKICSKLQTITGVESASADVKAGLIFVTPKASAAPSPRGMWEAVEKAGYKTVKLEGPSGSFNEKPKS